MLAPGMRPNSATAVEVCSLKSCTASTEIMESRLPKALNAGKAPPLDCAGRPPALTPVLALTRSEEHTSELQSLRHLVCRLLLEKKNNKHPVLPPGGGRRVLSGLQRAAVRR